MTKKKRKGDRRDYGLWALASDPAITVPGVLERADDGTQTLNLMGVLGARAGRFESLDGVHRIFGQLESLPTVTLENCFESSPPSPFSNVPRQVWHVNESLHGAWIDAAKPWAFIAAKYTMPGLTNWATWRMGRDPVVVENNVLLVRIALEQWELSRGDEVTVELLREGSISELGETNIHVEAPIVMHVRCARPMSSRELTRLAIRPVQILVGLAMGEFTTTTSARVKVEPDGHYLNNYTKNQDITADPGAAIASFGFKDLTELAPGACAMWFCRAFEIGVVLDLYVASLGGAGAFAEQRFLLAAQTLEVYHRLSFDSKPFEADAWRDLRKKLREVVELNVEKGMVRELLVSKMVFMNEMSLKQRLEHLLSMIGGSSAYVCGGEKKKFVNSIRDTRDHFTHWSGARAKTALTQGEGIVYATSRLVGLMELLLLKEIGFEEGSRPWKEVIRRRISWLPAGP
ncbi:MAG: HEPN domain-containing protein [Steroidobacteraceae bacterium]